MSEDPTAREITAAAIGFMAGVVLTASAIALVVALV